MALIPRTGSSPHPSPLSHDVTQSVSTYLEQAPYIKNSLTQRTAYNPETFDDNTRYLTGWLDGMRVSVTYYRRSMVNSDRKSTAIDNPMVRNIIHDQLECISCLELTFSEGLQPSYSEEQVEAGVRGDGWTYAGIKPNIGDLFLFPISDGQFLLFQITKVTPLGIRQERCSAIEFMATKFANDSDIQQLQARTIKTWHFDKETFFTTNSVVLDSDSYLQQQVLQNTRPLLIKDYYRNFWSNDAVSFINADGVYDPYVTKFMTTKISFDDEVRRATLVPPPNLDAARNQIWSLLLDTETTTVAGLYAGFETSVFLKYYTDTGIMGLLNRAINYIIDKSTVILTGPNAGQMNNPRYNSNQLTNNAWNNPGVTDPYPLGTPGCPDPANPGVTDTPYNYNQTMLGPFYVFSANFYMANITTMTPLELLVYNAITTRNVADVPGFITNFLNGYQSLSVQEKFFTIPLYLFLTDLALQSIVPNMPEGGF